MVGIIVGSGIFGTPPTVAAHIDSPILILALWTVGGALSLFGALTYAELGAMYPHSGGTYVFIREGFGRLPAFVFGWTYMLITKPSAAAGIAIIFATNVNTLLYTDWDPRVTTCLLLLALTIINTFRVTIGAGVALVLTILKVAALVTLAGFGLLAGGNSALAGSAPAFVGDWTGLIPAMAGILWTYDGWSDIAMIAGEVKDPRKNLPRLMFAGTAVTTLVYVAVNAAYIAMVPLGEMRTLDSVAPLAAQRMLGAAATVGVTLVIIVSTLGSTHGSILTGARITFAQARDGLLFRWLAAVHAAFGTPVASLWFQLALSCAAVYFLATFERMASTFVFSMWLFYGLAAAAVFILRFRRPDAERPYRCWGYPAVPALFILAALAITVLSVWQAPRDSLYSLGISAVGVPVYFAWEAFRSRPNATVK